MRFFWFKGNDPSGPIVEFRSKVHIFGNKPSPAVAIFALRHAVQQDAEVDVRAKSYVMSHFYVDDGLGSSDSPEEAVQILQETRKALAKFNIRLHKITSSSWDVIKAFPESERADDSHQICFSEVSVQRALGVAWDVKNDCFIIKVSVQDKPFTKRGVLSTINSVFDPLGVAGPVVLGGRLIQRAVIPP